MRKIWNRSSNRDKRKSTIVDDPLVKHDFDIKTVKHNWVNVTINNDVSEQNLRLFRAELKGCHLYLYRHHALSRFKVESNTNNDPTQINNPLTNHSNNSLTYLGSANDDSKSLANPTASSDRSIFEVPSDVKTISDKSIITDKSFVTDKELTLNEPDTPKNDRCTFRDNQSTLSLDQMTLNSLKDDNEDDYVITYRGTGIHPQLNYDFTTNKFVGNTIAIEPLIHFILFGSELDIIIPLINILPLLPNFAKILKLIQDYLHDKMSAPYINNITDRLLVLLNNIEINFIGFLLKNDIAPEIIKIIELLSASSNDPILLNKLVSFKQKMVSKQQNLLSLVSVNTGATPSPFTELNSLMFMKCNLFELTNTISAIDQRFFQKWNSNIDKSLLLVTSFNDPLYKKNPLIFNNDIHVHYLARLLVNHLFVETSSSLERKARLLEKWIDLGCLLDKLGNMSSWLGISSIILSQPVLRLNKVWSLVSIDYIKLLKNDWSPVLFELDRRHLANTDNKKDEDSSLANSTTNSANGTHIIRDSYHIMAPRGLGKIYAKETVIPYFGDLVINNEIINVEELSSVWKRINYSFNRWNEYLQNLNNYSEIISYNKDVLQRYDNMGFIFSNESLNQVLYLGSSTEERRLIGRLEGDEDKESGDSMPGLHEKLIKLIELNCDSINLEKIMKLSLVLEPDLPEAYLKSPTNTLNSTSNASTGKSLTIHGNDSNSSLTTLTNDDPSSRIPTFNNEYFKLNLSKYDELLTNTPQQEGDLLFRMDDFVNDADSANVSMMDDVDIVDEDDGLGIDVDDILNSEKFNNFTIKSDEPSSPADIMSKVNVNKYIPKYASIDKLIDLLLIDAKYFQEGIQLDLTEYRFVFLLNYNSFITTKQLLDKLAYRFINSGNAVISIMKQTSKTYNMPPGEFPNWLLDTSVDLKELGQIDYELLLKIQINILKVLIVLINNFYTNFSVELINKSILIKLLKLFSNEILQWYNSNKIDSNLEKSFENLVNYYKKLKKLFVKKSYRPIEINKFDQYLLKEFKFNNSLHEVPINRNLPGHKNVAKIEKFLLKFNRLLTIFYKGIKTEDWIKIFKIMENLFEQNNMWEFNLQKASTPDEYLIVSNVFHYFESLVEPQEKQLVLKKFPLVFRKLFKLYFKFKSYLLIQLADINITTDERLDRMKTLLSMIKISRIKMDHNQFVFESNGKSQMIPSCIETAVTNVLYSPESRYFSQLWIKAATSFHDHAITIPNLDDLDSLLPPNLDPNDIQTMEPLLPCFGWIIENLIETNKCPSYYKPGIINFNKRYMIFKLIKELGVEDVETINNAAGTPNTTINASAATSPPFDYHDTREFEFLLKLDDSLVSNNNLSFLDLKDKDKKLFRHILRDQHRILIIDNKKKILRDNSTVVHTSINSSSLLNKKASNLSLRRQSLSYKSNSSSRFKISGLFGKSRLSVNGATVPPTSSGASITEKFLSERELPEVEMSVDLKQKASAVISLKNKKIFPVYLLPLCFKIDSETGDSFVIQARSESDLNDWLVKLAYANRHWFYSRSLNMKSSCLYLTFGVPISLVCSREQSSYPRILTLLFENIEKEGLQDVGIYRISSSLSELNNIKSAIDKNGTLDFSERTYDVHALTSVVKSYFRELPDALLTDKVIEILFEIKQNDEENQDESNDMERYMSALKLLPTYNFNAFKLLLKHLNRVSLNSDENKMTASNLATVIGPALTEASSLDSLINKFGFMNTILEKLITNCGVLFDSERQRKNSAVSITSTTSRPQVPGTPMTNRLSVYSQVDIEATLLIEEEIPSPTIDRDPDFDEPSYTNGAIEDDLQEEPSIKEVS